MLILVFILSLMPSILLFLWLRTRHKGDNEYKTICNKALLVGIVRCFFLVFLLSTCFYIFERIIAYLGANSFITQMYHDFIVLALAEELIKYAGLKRVMKKYQYSYSKTDIIVLMMIVGIGFEIIEALVYAFGANAGMMIIRGVVIMHGSLGFIMGYFISKKMETGKKKYTYMGILVPFIFHGLYDFGLSDAVAKISDNIVFVSLLIAVLSIAVIIYSIIYVKKQDKNLVLEKNN